MKTEVHALIVHALKVANAEVGVVHMPVSQHLGDGDNKAILSYRGNVRLA